VAVAAILLSRTIFSTVVLLKFVSESAELQRAGVRAARLVGKGKKKDCMTDEQQEQVLRDFRSGKEQSG
jgi:ERCC4-related helicase